MNNLSLNQTRTLKTLEQVTDVKSSILSYQEFFRVSKPTAQMQPFVQPSLDRATL